MMSKLEENESIFLGPQKKRSQIIKAKYLFTFPNVAKHSSQLNYP